MKKWRLVCWSVIKAKLRDTALQNSDQNFAMLVLFTKHQQCANKGDTYFPNFATSHHYTKQSKLLQGGLIIIIITLATILSGYMIAHVS